MKVGEALQVDLKSFEYDKVVPFHPDVIRKHRNLYYAEGWQIPVHSSKDSLGAIMKTWVEDDHRKGWKLHRVVSGHSGIVHCMAVDQHNFGIDLSTDMNYQSSSTGNLFYTGSADCTIKCWEGFMGSCQLTLTGHTAGIHCIATSNEYPYIFSGGEDRDIRVWDLQGTTPSDSDGSICSAKISGSVNQTIAKLHGSLGCLYALSAHPRVPFLLASGGSDAAVRLWDIRCNRCVFSFFGHKGSVETLCTQPLEPQIISGGSDGTVHTWNLTAGKEQACEQLLHHKAYKYHAKSIRASFLHPKEYIYMSVSTDRFQYWNLPSFNQWKSVQSNQISRVSSGDTLQAACLSEKGDFFVTGHASGSLRFHDWQTGICYLEKQEQSASEIQLRIEGGKNVSSFSEQQRGVVAAVMNKGDNMLLTSLRDKTIHLYVNASE